MIFDFTTLCSLISKENFYLTTDSRRIEILNQEKSGVFVALPSSTSSHLGKKFAPLSYIENAINAFNKCRMSAYIVLEKKQYQELEKSKNFDEKAHYCIVEDTRKSLGILASTKFDTKELPFKIVGLTGTNGKTTSAYLLEHLYKECGKSVAILGTVSYHWNGKNGTHFEDAPLTTPSCLSLHEFLAKMKKAQIDVLIMEVSSHALDQERLAGIEFDAALFTNLTQDHLDYHENMENYFSAKEKLFSSIAENTKTSKSMSIFAADDFGKRLLAKFPQAEAYILHEKEKGECSCLSSSNTLLHAQLLENNPTGLTIQHKYKNNSWTIKTSLVGEHNAYNILGVECLALQLGFKVEDLQHLATFKGVPGRLERVYAKSMYSSDNNISNSPSFFVDYAHTPDALVQAQSALRKANFKRIITVFGCGGDRDRSKRPLMGAAVAKASDIVILTSDNPRTENPEQILDDIIPALKDAKEVHRMVNRREALELAVKLAQSGDAVLVAGKGHETYQIIGTEKSHFSDQEILQELLS